MDTNTLSGSPVVLESSRTIVALSTWGLSFCVLLVGGAVGTGPDAVGLTSHVSTLVAVALWLIACGVALSDDAARRSMGLLHATLVVGLVAGGYAGEFRFIWASDSIWMVALEGVVAVMALILLAPRSAPQNRNASRTSAPRTPHRFSVEGRALLWTLLGVCCSMTGYNIGMQVERPVLGVGIGVATGFVLYLGARALRVVRGRRGSATCADVPSVTATGMGAETPARDVRGTAAPQR